MIEEQLKSENLQSLLAGILRMEYSLLLGAGASIGAYCGDGKPVPAGQALASEILEDFGIQVDGVLPVSLRDKICQGAVPSFHSQ